MQPRQLLKLSDRELQNLLELQKRILDVSVLFEKELLTEGSRRQLEEIRNEALDKMTLIKAELKRREL